MSDNTDKNEINENADKVSRRNLLGGAAVAGGLGALGLGIWQSDRDSYLTDVDRGAIEQMAGNQRNRVDQAAEDLEETNSSIPLPKNIEEYNDRGHRPGSGVLLRYVDSDSPETFVVPREEDGESVEYVSFEPPQDHESEEMSLASVVDRTDNDIGDIAVSQMLENQKQAEVEEFRHVVPYLRSGDNSPSVSEEDLDEVESIKQELDETINGSYLTLISELEDVSNTSGDLINDEIGESDRETITTIGSIMWSGEGYRKDNHLTETEAGNLIQGQEEYEDMGLDETKTEADAMLQEVTAETVKTAILSDTLGKALEKAGRTSDFYFSESEEVYAGLDLDEELEEEIDSYAEDRNLSSGELEYQVRSKDGEVTLRYGESLDSGDYEEISIGE